MASIDVIQVNAIEDEDDKWMNDLVGFLINGAIQEDEKRAKKVRLQASRFEMRNSKLYKRSYGGPMLRCVNGREA